MQKEHDININFLSNCYGIDIGASGPCPCGCRFCFVDYNGANFKYNIPYKTVEQVHEQIECGYSLNKKNFIVYSEPETDIFANPHIYDILKLFNNNYPDSMFLLNTNGVLLKKNKIEECKSYKNIFFQLSVHTMNEEYRKKIARFSNRDIIVQLLNGLKGLVFLEPYWDLDIFKEDINIIRKCGFIGQIIIRRIDHTQYTPDDGKEMSIVSCNNYKDALNFIYNNEKSIGALPLLPLFERLHKNSRFYIHMENNSIKIKQAISNLKGSILVLTSELAFSWIKYELSSFNNIKIDYMKNSKYGGSIGCAGLLIRNDLLSKIKEYDMNAFDYIILPGAMRSNKLLTSVFKTRQAHPIDNYADLKKIGNAQVIFHGEPTLDII